MKRITKEIKKLQLIANLIDIVYAVVAAIVVGYLFVLLIEPAAITDVVDPNTAYTLFGFDIVQTTVNLLIGLLLGYLLVFVPTAARNMKRYFSKEAIELDEWSYRTQHLYMVMSFFTLNPFSAVLRYIIGFEMKQIVRGYKFKQTMINAGEKTKLFFSGETFRRAKERKERRAAQSESQQDLEKVSQKDFVMKIVRLSITYTFLTLMALFIFIPFYWMILTALKTNTELTEALNPRFVVGLGEMQWVNFKLAITRFNFGTYIWNTVSVGVITMLGTVTTTILAAFAFARLDFKGRDFIFSVLLLTMMIPGELYTITNYVTVSNFGWIDTMAALIFPFMVSVFYIFFLRQSFKQIPDTLYQAARVDGCGDFKYLTRVMIPIAKPTIITIIILSAIGAWDAYIWPQLVTRTQDNWLISVALRGTSFTTDSGASDARPVYNVQLAATALVTVPLVILFFTLKKFIISGVGRSGTKG
jgi:ABC-type glycerol-3-phosphate transport system permease component